MPYIKGRAIPPLQSKESMYEFLAIIGALIWFAWISRLVNFGVKTVTRIQNASEATAINIATLIESLPPERRPRDAVMIQLPKPSTPRPAWQVALILGAIIGGMVLLNSKGHAETVAADAANIGDIVTVKYASTRILCEDPHDASKVYMTGYLAADIVLGRGGSIDSALETQIAAEADAMQAVHSCTQAVRHLHYQIVQKDISGTDGELFHAVKYCLRPDGKNSCLWLTVRFSAYSPFEVTNRVPQ